MYECYEMAGTFQFSNPLQPFPKLSLPLRKIKVYKNYPTNLKLSKSCKNICIMCKLRIKWIWFDFV